MFDKKVCEAVKQEREELIQDAVEAVEPSCAGKAVAIGVLSVPAGASAGPGGALAVGALVGLATYAFCKVTGQRGDFRDHLADYEKKDLEYLDKKIEKACSRSGSEPDAP